MKQKVTISIEKGWLERTKNSAQAESRSLSNYIENLIYADLRSQDILGITATLLVKDMIELEKK